MVDKSNNIHVSKYIRIANDIEELINSGMDVGEKIYSENEVMDKYGVSSTTVSRSSLYQLYELYNIKIAHSRQVLELSFINKSFAKFLNCKEGDPIIHIEGLLSLEDYTPIEYENSFWNDQKCGFYFESSL